MKKKTWSVLIVLLAVMFVSSGAPCAEKDSFWDTLRLKLHKITPAKKADVTTTSVAGVRGAKNDSDSDIYWKGKDKSGAVTEEELKKFNLAVETKGQGNNEQALKQFEEFLNVYPQSPLRVDALKALEKIKIEIGLIKAPEIKAEEPAQVKAEAKRETPAKTAKKTAKKKAATVK